MSTGRSNETSPTQGLRPTRLLRSCALRDCESPFFVRHRSLFHLYLVIVCVYNPLVCLSKLVMWLDGLGQVVKRQHVVQQPKFLALCVWRRFHIELGGAGNQSAPGAEIRKVLIQLQDPVGSPRWLLTGEWCFQALSTMRSAPRRSLGGSGAQPNGEDPFYWGARAAGALLAVRSSRAEPRDWGTLDRVPFYVGASRWGPISV